MLALKEFKQNKNHVAVVAQSVKHDTIIKGSRRQRPNRSTENMNVMLINNQKIWASFGE